MNNRPITTLFLLTSVDGKISTGSMDTLDFDKDLPLIPGVKEGLHQYYDVEQQQEGWFLESGRTQAKVGVNKRALADEDYGVNFVVFDNKHLTTHGVDYFLSISKELYIVTSNPNHPAYRFEAPSLHILFYPKSNPKKALEDLYALGCQKLVIETGGTMNAVFLRQKLIDYVDIVVAPVLVGGKDTPSLVDGLSLILPSELNELGVLELIDATKLENSYLRLRYKVIA